MQKIVSTTILFQKIRYASILSKNTCILQQSFKLINTHKNDEQTESDVFGIGSKFADLDSTKPQRRKVSQKYLNTKINQPDSDTFGTLTNELDNL